MSVIEDRIRPIITEAMKEAYERGYKAGYTARELEEKKDEERRLGQVYTFGYELGAEDAYAKLGVVDIDEVVKEVGDLE